MRSLGLALCALLLGGTAFAGRASPAASPNAVSVADFDTPEDLSIFGPEVARAVAEALTQAGVEVAPSGARVEGRIEPVDSDRVRLLAEVSGHSVQAEGALEQVDALAVDLAVRLVPLLPPSARPGRPKATGKRLAVRSGHDDAARESAAGLPAVTLAGLEPVAPKGSPPTGRQPTRAVGAIAPATTTPHAAGDTAERKRAEPRPTVTANPAPERLSPPDKPASATERASVDDKTAPTKTPPDDGPRADPPYARLAAAPHRSTPPPEPPHGPRVVLNGIRLPDGSCSASEPATRAARDVLLRNAIPETVHGGCGIAPPAAANEEAARAGAYAVVMGEVSWVRIQPAVFGYRASGEVRVIAVRDGRPVINVIYPLSSRIAPSGDPTRAAIELATLAFQRLGRSLGTALAPPR